MLSSLEKANLTINSIYTLFLNKEVDEGIEDPFDMPEEIKPTDEECGCDEGEVCDCKFELCDSVRSPTVYQANTHTAIQTIVKNLEEIKAAYL